VGKILLDHKKILILDVLGLGDLVMQTPFAKALKEKYPTVTLSYVVKPIYKEILERLPFVDYVYTYYRSSFLEKLKMIPRLYGQDYVIFTNNQVQLLYLAKLVGIPYKIGTGNEKYIKQNLLQYRISNWVYDTPEYAAKTITDEFCKGLNIDLNIDSTDISISVANTSEKNTVDGLLRDKNIMDGEYICLAPFTSYQRTYFPMKYAKTLVDKIENELKIPVVLIGGKSNYNDSLTIGGYNLVGKTTLMEMVEVIRRARVFIGPDSGPMHVAGALNVTSIALFSRDLPSRWAPKKDNCHVITVNMPCSPCSIEIAEACKTRRCIKEVTPEWVFMTLKDVLQEGK
jgi:ADP-heptose:LPS heptosyltransferase